MELLRADVESALDLVHAGLAYGALKWKLDFVFVLVVQQSI